MTLAEQAAGQMIEVYQVASDHMSAHRCAGQSCPVVGALLDAAYVLSDFARLPSPDPLAYADVSR